jgi:hypothetical protein
MMRKGRRIRRAGVTACAVLLASASVLAQAPPSSAFSVVSQRPGFDTCAAPSAALMTSWWTNSPYYNIGIYLGGSNRSCSQPNLTSSWVSSAVNGPTSRWGLIPLWVGPQMPNGTCTSRFFNTYVSLNTTTAYNQGRTEGSNAYTAAVGLNMDVTDMPLVLDLEGYNGATACRDAAKSYVSGWTYQLSLYPAQRSGVYGSASNSYPSDWATLTRKPDFIFFAEQNSTGSNVNASNYLSGTLWTQSQRHKQYVLDSTATTDRSFGGYSVSSVDKICSNGPVYGLVAYAASVCTS